MEKKVEHKYDTKMRQTANIVIAILYPEILVFVCKRKTKKMQLHKRFSLKSYNLCKISGRVFQPPISVCGQVGGQTERRPGSVTREGGQRRGGAGGQGGGCV